MRIVALIPLLTPLLTATSCTPSLAPSQHLLCSPPQILDLNSLSAYQCQHVHNLPTPPPTPPSKKKKKRKKKSWIWILCQNLITRELKIGAIRQPLYDWYFRGYWSYFYLFFFEIWIVSDTIQCVDGFHDGSCLRLCLFRPHLSASASPRQRPYGEGILLGY